MARPKHRTLPGNTWERRAMFTKPEWAEIVERKTFEYRDKGEYALHRYVVMPDHLHAILTPSPGTTLERATQLIKGGSSHDLGVTSGTRFPVWQPGFTQHLIRNQTDYDTHARYVDMNSVKAGLAPRTGEYAFCSAHGRYRLDPWPVAPGGKPLDGWRLLRRG
jgi:putative transposase